MKEEEEANESRKRLGIIGYLVSIGSFLADFFESDSRKKGKVFVNFFFDV